MSNIGNTPPVHTLKYVTLSEILDNEENDEYNMFCDIINNYYSWGDTDFVLVTQEELKSRLGAKIRDDRLDSEELDSVRKLYAALDMIGDDTVLVNLY